MTTLNMHPVSNKGDKLDLKGGKFPFFMACDKLLQHRGTNAFAPSSVFDNNYFSSFYYPGIAESNHKYEDRMFLDRPIFNIVIRPRNGCWMHTHSKCEA